MGVLKDVGLALELSREAGEDVLTALWPYCALSAPPAQRTTAWCPTVAIYSWTGFGCAVCSLSSTVSVHTYVAFPLPNPLVAAGLSPVHTQALRAAAAAGSLPTSQHDPHRRGSAAGRRLYRLSSAGNGGWLPLRGSVSGGDQAAAPAAAALAWGGIAAMGSGELHVPLLTVVDETGAASTMPQGAVPIAINWQRYRSRSHVSRMSL